MKSFLQTLLPLFIAECVLADIISLEKQQDYMAQYDPPMSATDRLMTNLFKPIGHKLHEGDMMLTSAQKKQYSMKPNPSGSAPAALNPWSGNKVSYKIAKPGPSKELVEGAMAHWSENTCAKFSESGSGSLTIKYGEGCYATVGSGSKQELVLHSDCESEPVLVHLLGHVLGVPHMHSRPDRDKFLYVRPHNGLTADFMYLNSKDLTSCPLNYQSIMMYDTYGLSRSGEAVFLSSFTSKSGLMASSTIGIQEAEISKIDAAWLKNVLKCGGAAGCKPPEPEPEPCDVNLSTDNKRYQTHALSFDKMDRSKPNNCVWKMQYTGKEKCVRAGFLIIFETSTDIERRLFLFSTGCRFFQVEVFDPVFESSQFYCGSEFVRKANKMFMTGGMHHKRGTSRTLYAFARFRATSGPVSWRNKNAAGELGKTGNVYAFTVEDVYCSDKISPVAPCF